MEFIFCDHPLIAISINTNCNQRCIYCHPKGEGYACMEGEMSLDFFESIIENSIKLGFKGFRISGGEPTIHSRFKEILNILMKYKSPEVYYSLNTNGENIDKYLEYFDNDLFNLVRVSLDTTNADSFYQITGSKNYERILENSIKLVNRNIPVRINMVVIKSNYQYIEEMISLCLNNRFDLKLLDFEKYENDNNIWEDQFVNLKFIREKLRARTKCSYWISPYGGFGIPMEEFDIGLIKVRVKDSTIGSTYHPNCWEKCINFPCPEGIYAIIICSDASVTWCRRRREIGSINTSDHMSIDFKIKSVFNDMIKAKTYMHNTLNTMIFGKIPLLPIGQIQNGNFGIPPKQNNTKE